MEGSMEESLKAPLLPSGGNSSLDSADAVQEDTKDDGFDDQLSMNSFDDAGSRNHNDIGKFDQFDASIGTLDTGTANMHNIRQSIMGPVAIAGMDLLGENISRVERSWLVISERNRIGAVGLKFFLKLFDEHPEVVELFPFGEDSKDPKTGKLKINARTKRHLEAHATAVMGVVGTCVAGLASIEDLVPRLRSVGATHKIAGVQNMHYDILYGYLVNGIKEEVGPQNWDEETENAWEQAFLSITDLMKRPSKRLETEPLKGWGLVMLLACLYFSIVTRTYVQEKRVFLSHHTRVDEYH